jgi:hypothetical protein
VVPKLVDAFPFLFENKGNIVILRNLKLLTLQYALGARDRYKPE